MNRLQLERYGPMGPRLWSFEQLPHGVKVLPIPVVAEDGGESHGTLYARGGEKTVVCIMHPRSDMQRHYAIPWLVDAGLAAWGQACRFVNNEAALIYEHALLDVAAALCLLKDRGYQRIVLLGSSGGGPLAALYQSQALRPSAARLTDTAAGDPLDLASRTLPEADGMVQLAAHAGPGHWMMSILDPSVTDEKDPLSIDPSLDMYDAANGFREPPEPSHYDDAFLARYRQAQRARVARIDAIAKAHIEEQRFHQERVGAPDFEALPLRERQWCLRRAHLGRYFEVHRTEAQPAYTDLSIQPSEREIGSFLSPRPDVFNYTEGGFGKTQTPRAWLSTWSALSSRASTLACLEGVKTPQLVIAYTGDNAVFSDHTDAIHAASPALDKQMYRVKGDHLGFGAGGPVDTSGREAALKIVVSWICERF